ncbi:DNA-binding protein [Candidatus Marinimicrobia bacterium MT.SAG.3]|nr:DNA-binding protein [Candidatus Marinimicrobia bacterium MT.SAG.3]
MKRTETLSQIFPESKIAGLFGIAKATIARMRKRGEIPFAEIGGHFYYSEAHLVEWFDARVQQTMNGESP